MYCGGCNTDYQATFFSVAERRTLEMYRRCQLCLATSSHVPHGKPPFGSRYIIVRDHAWCSSCKVWHTVDHFHHDASQKHGLCKSCITVMKQRVKSPARQAPPKMHTDPSLLLCGVCQETKASGLYHRSEAIKPSHARICKQCVAARSVVPTLRPVRGGASDNVRGYHWCGRCATWKPQEVFRPNKSKRNGLQTECNACMEAYHREYQPRYQSHYKERKSIYVYPDGLDYQTLYERQHGVCAICRQPETVRSKNGKVKQLAVDHDHDTGFVRGLLCSRCNLGIGYFQDCPNNLTSAIRYLKQSQS